VTTRLPIFLIIVATSFGWPSVAVTQHDLSGVWMRERPGNGFSDAPPPPLTAWGLERFAANRPTVGPAAALDANDPTLDCAAPGVPYVLAVPTPFEFVQIGGEVIQIFEYNHFLRRIHTDGRRHPGDLRATGAYEWMGHSIGRWEGDTFVIDTIGFNDETWIDRLGHPHSDALHLVERLRRVTHDTLQYDVTVEDPKAFTAPWSGRMIFRLRPDWEILEHICTTTAHTYQQFKDNAWQPAK
jgi:hypothetical protein